MWQYPWCLITVPHLRSATSRRAGQYEGWDNDPHAALGEPWGSNTTCREHTSVSGTNEWNEITNPLLVNAGIPLLRVYHPSKARWMDHHGRRPHDTYKKRSILDCAHYCLPSAALDYWTRALIETVVSLRQEVRR